MTHSMVVESFGFWLRCGLGYVTFWGVVESVGPSSVSWESCLEGRNITPPLKRDVNCKDSGFGSPDLLGHRETQYGLSAQDVDDNWS